MKRGACDKLRNQKRSRNTSTKNDPLVDFVFDEPSTDNLHLMQLWLQKSLSKTEKRWKGKLIFTRDHSMLLYDVHTRKEFILLEADLGISVVQTLENGNVLVFCNDAIMEVGLTGKIVNKVHAKNVLGLQELSDGNIAVTHPDSVSLLSRKTNTIFKSVSLTVTNVFQTNDGRIAVVGEFPKITLYDRNLNLLEELSYDAACKLFPMVGYKNYMEKTELGQQSLGQPHIIYFIGGKAKFTMYFGTLMYSYALKQGQVVTSPNNMGVVEHTVYEDERLLCKLPPRAGNLLDSLQELEYGRIAYQEDKTNDIVMCNIFSGTVVNRYKGTNGLFRSFVME
jgi:hypothetical protein